MPPLPSELRSSLETSILNARDAAERAAKAALLALAVDRDRPFPTLNVDQRRHRNALRARARQLCDDLHPDGWQPLIEEVAYIGWHRMLFARFLAENNLLMHPSGVPVTLQDCSDLAPEEGEPDAWSLAARYASLMLPGIFLQEDPSSQVRFAPEGRNELERILVEMPPIFFTADDALGWVYQFWQTKKKSEVNNSERKIGEADLYPVTQLFTEDYMVRFLLENSLGAWWAARHPRSPLIKEWKYIRWQDEIEEADRIVSSKDGMRIPAARTFSGWPDNSAEITIMDPCCGSGHFLVVALSMLYKMRMEEDKLSITRALDSVIQDNLYGLEIDPRCTQIAAFSLAFAAWKIGGYREIPVPNIACSGISINEQIDNLPILTEKTRISDTLKHLLSLLKNANTLGSLINPTDIPIKDRMFSADYETVVPYLVKALAKSHDQDLSAAVFGLTMEGAVRAAKMLTSNFTLVITNVPYLSRGKQSEVLMDYCERRHDDSKNDLAMCFLERCLSFCSSQGTTSVVLPQSLLYQPIYTDLRKRVLQRNTWDFVGALGPNAFEAISGEVVNVILFIISASHPLSEHKIPFIDANVDKNPDEKAKTLRTSRINLVHQLSQIDNPDSRVIPDEIQTGKLLTNFATTHQGMKTGDDPRYVRCFWEIPDLGTRWLCYQRSTKRTTFYGGLEHIIDWKNKGKDMARLQGKRAFGKKGIAISQMRNLSASIYTGEIFDSNISPIIPYEPDYIEALWLYCSSTEFVSAIRSIDKSLKVTNSTFLKIPFDLSKYKRDAENFSGLPKPNSSDPTQWLFNGNPQSGNNPLQVSICRLLGYCWPNQNIDHLDQLCVQDGIVCLPPIAGELSGAERLRSHIANAFGTNWSHTKQSNLLSNIGYGGKKMEDWLRDGFFTQHCKLFHNRPFIWQIWDRQRDGFSVLVNYHKLDNALLGRLIYTYLGDWINIQRRDTEAGVAGADGRLVAAINLKEKLELIRKGEPPYDIYIRWKPLHEQPIGWNPDLNNGVRLNIRPFVKAGILRSKFAINWKKDRGKNPDGIERINDLHFTISEKMEARRKAGVA